MAAQTPDRKDVLFTLFDQLEAHKLAKTDRYAGLDRKAMELVLNEARNLSIKEILPTFAEGDREGCRFEDGKVFAPQCYHRAFDLLREGEWIALIDDPEMGGQGLPICLAAAANEYFNAANTALMTYATLTRGAARLIEVFGDDRLRALFVKKMYQGEWGGTMLLTEPEAGSDVGALTTTATPNDDGTYSITGTKIFITAGEHDLAENIIHPVLARIEGAPAGTKGISLFCVPKIWVEPDGSLGEPNDVVCAGIEKKMGLSGSATCTLSLGGSGKCRGFLLGEPNKGMRAMFQMMNEARLGVGVQGLSMASAAYGLALDYAKNRVQGRELARVNDPAAEPVPIIRHPDVRRMLLWMKAHLEGMRALTYYTGLLIDRELTEADEAARKEARETVDLLIPVVKGYITDRAFEICALAVQVYGGYGYIKEYPVEQLVRDCKITSIYEGTNGIQAMDLLGRKLPQSGGKPFMNLLAAMNETAATAEKSDRLSGLAAPLKEAAGALGETAMTLGAGAMTDKLEAAFSFAHPFLTCMGDICMAWMLLWRANVAEKLLKKGKDKPFYEGRLITAEYYIHSVLPETMGRMNAIKGLDPAVVDMPEQGF